MFIKNLAIDTGHVNHEDQSELRAFQWFCRTRDRRYFADTVHFLSMENKTPLHLLDADCIVGHQVSYSGITLSTDFITDALARPCLSQLEDPHQDTALLLQRQRVRNRCDNTCGSRIVARTSRAGLDVRFCVVDEAARRFAFAGLGPH
jgi:hypothetical protein